jgi:hypothetical protein
MADYRDPKVTTTGTKRDSNTGKWIGIAVAALVVLLLIAWWAGAFNGTEIEPVTTAPTTETPATTTPPAGGTATTTPPAGGTTTETPPAGGTAPAQ